ncbi:Na-Ca exchanger/integrin-beta4 [Beggiatoa sp. PS]|nr:Na-Ca exchanger/integrin-beta4 [Beggiatoa sp. PS]
MRYDVPATQVPIPEPPTPEPTPDPTPEPTPSTGDSSSTGGSSALSPTMILTISMEGNGSGNVTSDPNGIDCDTEDEECKSTFETAIFVELTAEPDNGSEFSSWRGHSDCVDGKVFLNGNRFCEAVFQLLPVPEIHLSKTTLDITEGSGADSYSVWFNTEPIASVTIKLDANDADIHNGRRDISLNTNELVFNDQNWEQPQTVEVFHQDENVADGAHEHLIQHIVTSQDSDYNGMTLGPVSVRIMDNDSAGIHLSTYDIHIKEGQNGANYSIMLLTQPQSNVTIQLKTESDSSGEPEQTRITPAILTFTPNNWNVPQDIIVSVNDDTVPEGAHDRAIAL